MAGEKTEKATPKRRKDERKKGNNVFVSKDVTALISILTVFYSVKLLFPECTESQGIYAALS